MLQTNLRELSGYFYAWIFSNTLCCRLVTTEVLKFETKPFFCYTITITFAFF